MILADLTVALQSVSELSRLSAVNEPGTETAAQLQKRTFNREK